MFLSALSNAAPRSALSSSGGCARGGCALLPRRTLARVLPSAVSSSASATRLTGWKKLQVVVVGHHLWMEPFAAHVADCARLLPNTRASGVVMLPSRRKPFVVNKSPFVKKKARERFELRTHRRLVQLETDPLSARRFVAWLRDVCNDVDSFYFGRIEVKLREFTYLPLTAYHAADDKHNDDDAAADSSAAAPSSSHAWVAADVDAEQLVAEQAVGEHVAHEQRA